MPPHEILQVFDSVEPSPDYPGQPGDVKCCAVSVPMYDQRRLTCLKCGRTIEDIGGHWMVTRWGAKGIKISGWSQTPA
jgi:hypothetical protein